MKKILWFLRNSSCCSTILAGAFLLFTFSTHAQYITTIAGNDTSGFRGDGGPAILAELSDARISRPDHNGNVYIADRSNFRIRKVDTNGIITTIAGTGSVYYSGDGGAATAAGLAGPSAVFADSIGNVYLSDGGGGTTGTIRKINTDGIITLFAGGGTAGDGSPATAALLPGVSDVVVDWMGNCYICDPTGYVHKVDTSGIIHTVAGNGTLGFSGDGGPATLAQLYQPEGIAVDTKGNLYIADMVNQRIRKVDTAGIISTIAGIDTFGFSGDGGPATTAKLWYPFSVAVDNIGDIFIADEHNSRIRKIDTAGIITTFAGDSTVGYLGDGGPATSAELGDPEGVALDDSGNLYITDEGYDNVRKVSAHLPQISGITTVGVKDKAALSIYPNPNDGAFTFCLSAPATSPVQIIITNIVGQKIKELTTATNKNTAIQLAAPPGLYFITATTGQGVYSGKMVINQ